MTERKPPNVDFETWVDKQIREATERGAFDDLPGSGKPLPDLDKPYDELWWIKQKVQREGLSTEALLPAPLQLRKEIERLPETVPDLLTEQAVRDTVSQLNLRIVEWMRAPSGPRVHLRPVDVDSVVQQWRASRPAPNAPASETPNQRSSARRPRWWHRITRGQRRTG